MTQARDQLIAGFINPKRSFAMSVGPAGLKYLPLAQVMRAWRIRTVGPHNGVYRY